MLEALTFAAKIWEVSMRPRRTSDTDRSASSQKSSATKIDIFLCAALPSSVLTFVCLGLAWGHSALHAWAGVVYLGLIVSLGLLLILPALTIVWIASNRGQTAETVLWLESFLAGLLSGSTLARFLAESNAEPPGIIIFLAAAALATPIVLTPYFPRRRRQPKTT